MAAASSAVPRSSIATVRTTGGCQPARGPASPSSARNWLSSRSAPSRSALFSTKMSAISITPAFRFWTSSPRPGTSTSSVQSASRATSISSWPTPTVSTRMICLPAASSTSAASAVACASPPSQPRVAIERMKTPSSVACACMRMRSPRMAPPVNGLDGSTASTPTASPCRR